MYPNWRYVFMAKKQNKKKKKENPKYGLIGFVKFLSFIIPLVLYLLIILLICPSPNSGFIFMGVIGCFIFGLGLVNVAGLLDDGYLGHLLTFIPILIGSLLLGISSLIIYTPSIYSKIDEHQVSFYFLSLAVLLVSIIYYVFFRGAVSNYLREKGLSKTKIKELTKGTRNFWWYEKINETYKVNWVFHLNKAYTIVYIATLLLHLFLGWWSMLIPMITILVCLVLALNIPMWYLVVRTRRQVSSKKSDNTMLFWLGGYLFPTLAIIAIIMFCFK